ncbi:MAG: bifunctional 4-hydroxy-3-methylbut-2-enyl diphosphate reductase/30S ribosomal protein S1 [Eubacteriaceae bacterium]
MRNVTVAKTAGFCFGVDRAIKKLDDVIKQYSTPIYTMGPIIHNKQVIEKYEKAGVKTADNINQITPSSVVVIRSHGIGKDQYEHLKEKNVTIIDATCPYVRKVQNIVNKYKEGGYKIIIIGDEHHPEVTGVNGWCGGDAIIINDKKNIPIIEKYDKICVVAQTTIIESLFEDITNEIKSRCADVQIFNTICAATEERQKEAAEIAAKSDMMIVVGGYDSSNTKKLAEICRKYCCKTMHIETAEEIDLNILKECNKVGITAGASSPAWIIKEVAEKSMEEQNNILQQYEETFKKFKPGDIMEGEIISVNSDCVVMNIGGKSDGIIKKDEFMQDLYEDLMRTAAIGDRCKVMVISTNDGAGNIVLSKLKVDEIEAKEKLQEQFDGEEILTGTISKVVKGGVMVDLGSLSAFMPASYYDIKFVKDLNALVGKSITGRIVEYNPAQNRIIFSHKVLLVEEIEKRKAEQRAVKEAAVAELELGQIVQAKVKNFTDYCVFVDLNGVDGFIHMSDLTWKSIKKPSDALSAGQVVQAKITELDKENFKIKLSIKELTQNPWEVFKKKYKEGEKATVKITSLANYGAFAEIIPDLEGLIHISQFAHTKIDRPESMLKVGDEVEVLITKIEEASKKISLSIKDLTPAPKKKIEKNKKVYSDDDKVTIGDLFGKIKID